MEKQLQTVKNWLICLFGEILFIYYLFIIIYLPSYLPTPTWKTIRYADVQQFDSFQLVSLPVLLAIHYQYFIEKVSQGYFHYIPI